MTGDDARRAVSLANEMIRSSRYKSAGLRRDHAALQDYVETFIADEANVRTTEDATYLSRAVRKLDRESGKSPDEAFTTAAEELREASNLRQLKARAERRIRELFPRDTLRK